MATYYVDATTGDDSDDGLSEANAWQTLDKVKDEFAATTFSAGDSILFKRGETFDIPDNNYSLHIKNSTGAIGNPIYIGDYGSGNKPIFNVTAPIADGAIFIYHTDGGGEYITIENIEITTSATGEDFIGIYWRGHNNLVVKNCYIHDIPASVPGISAGIVLRKSASFCTIDTCTINYIEGEGVYLGQDNDLTDRPLGNIVKNCDISYCDSEGIDVKDGPAFLTVSNTNISYCGIGGGHDTYQINLGGRYHHFYNCHIFGQRSGCRAGIYLGRYTELTEWSGRYITIERCLIEGMTNTNGGIRVRGDNNTVINCTIIDCINAIYADSHAYDGAGAQVIKNCIFDGSVNYDVYMTNSEGNYTFDYNCYSDGVSGIWYENGASRDYAYVNGLGQETNAVTSDADFAETTNYTLNSGSPCENAGDSSVTNYDWNNEYTPSGSVDMGWKEIDWNTFRVFTSDFTNLNNFSGSSGVTANNLLNVVIDDTSNRSAHRSSLGNLNYFYSQFYINTSALTMANGDEFAVFEAETSGATTVIQILLQYDGSNYRIRASVLDDVPATNYTSYYNLSGGWNYIQTRWYGANDTSENEGFLLLILNGTEEEFLTGLNNHDNTVDRIDIGSPSGLDVGTSDTLYFDNLDIDLLRELGTSEPNNIPPPQEVTTITVTSTTTVTVLVTG